ncbi:hypothetical protein CLU83_2087 [Flavobacterium sp. 1]|uniref:hypothetical protein n=1 Tax=Flavobacterium sp. 1 TaxID=2035200 RepID=UPI000C23A665|nr:hypothetical protein [Flavobacterium sp. 1]PJJ08786.1 hypothetical protein CLU83_2087 [Flavobacterium sp. 1]
MKKFTILLVLSLVGYTATCQTQPPKLDELNIPSSPAFVMLDESPANIEKPTNPKAFAISLLNVGKNGGAIETTPYWLINHANYTFVNDVENHFPILQTFAISLASVKNADTTIVSLGFRVQLFRQYFNEKAILISKNKIVDLLSVNPKDIDTTALQVEKNKLDADRGRTKYNLELAGAYSGQGTNYENLSGTKLGIWANFRYTPMVNSFLDIVALARYSKVIGGLENQIPDSSFLDFGGGLSRQGSNYDIQLEYIYRRDTTIDINYDRLAFIVNYQIIPGMVAVASFGKNFDDENNIFTAFGIKFGISNRKNNE